MVAVAGCASRGWETGDAVGCCPVSDATAQSTVEPRSQEHGNTAEVIPASFVEAGEASSSSMTSLHELEESALANNPTLRRLEQEVNAAWAKTGYADKLPDPTIGSNVFASPIETAAGSQRANLTVMQMIPWLERLEAQVQQATYEALVLQEGLRSEQLRVTADLRAAWYRLFVLGKQVETYELYQKILKSLMDTLNVPVPQRRTAPGDIELATLEYARLEEELVGFRQQIVSQQAELNRLLGREARYPVSRPVRIEVALPNWDHESLVKTANGHQPAIVAAELRTQATRWGVEVARLRRRPDVSLNATWFAIDDNRPSGGVVDAGDDAFSLGAQVSIPVWRQKYDAMETEANWKHLASHESVEEVRQRYDALLLDLWERARTADETRRLYEKTIIPQAQQTLNADQQSLPVGAVEFDRVMKDFRTVLTLHLALHRTTGELATLLARIEQAAGGSLSHSGAANAVDVPLPEPR